MSRDGEPGGRPEVFGGIYVDLTAKRADGSAVRVLLVDTLADGVTPTARDRSAAARIRAAKPRDELRLVPKARDTNARVEDTKSVASRAIRWARKIVAKALGR